MRASILRNVLMAGTALVIASTLAASAEGLSGEYGQTETGQWFTILDFTSASDVTLTMIGSEDRMDGTYARDGDTVTISAAGEIRALTIDGDGCLDGGAGNAFFAGTVCAKP